MNAARSVRVVLDAHTRPAHTICQNEVSNALVQFGSSLCRCLSRDERTWQSVSQNRTSNARAVWAAWVTTWRCGVATWTQNLKASIPDSICFLVVLRSSPRRHWITVTQVVCLLSVKIFYSRIRHFQIAHNSLCPPPPRPLEKKCITLSSVSLRYDCM